jgi:hypothetical protein
VIVGTLSTKAPGSSGARREIKPAFTSVRLIGFTLREYAFGKNHQNGRYQGLGAAK